MISGFNTDIEFAGTMYHVQTEDKGLPSRLIMSLVYDGGTILASKRVSYDDLAGNIDEKELSKRVSRQHKLICAAVRAGRMDELKEMTAKSTARGGKPKPETVAAVVESAAPMISKPAIPLPTAETVVAEASIPTIKIETRRVINVEQAQPFDDSPLFEAVEVLDEEEIFPADAVAVVSELSGQERSANTKLSLELLGETRFKGGDRRTVKIMVCRGTGRKVVAEAQIMIKVIGSSFRPVIFHARSDANGLAKIHLQLPHFRAGRAALLVRAISGGEEIELRKVVMPG